MRQIPPSWGCCLSLCLQEKSKHPEWLSDRSKVIQLVHSTPNSTLDLTPVLGLGLMVLDPVVTRSEWAVVETRGHCYHA